MVTFGIRLSFSKYRRCGKGQALRSMWASTSGRKRSTTERTGPIAASPRAQRELPPMFFEIDSRSSGSPSRPSPCSIRSSTSSIQFVPSRQGVHWPQDSWLKNLARRAAARTMQVVSSITITAAEPSMEPALATVSKSILMSICSAVSIGAEAPPGMKALSVPAPVHAAAPPPASRGR